MTFAQVLTGQFTKVQYIDFFARILVACICGAAIGFERSMRFKEAGIRTHVIVCCAASLMMIVSKYGFADMSDNSGISWMRSADPARVAAQVVTGISFLGAGMIFRNGKAVSGLTTAAGIWATSGIGLAIGAGLYMLGIFATLIIAVLQIFMHKYAMTADTLVIGQIHCRVVHSETFRAALNKFIEEHRMQVISSKLSYNDDGTASYDVNVRVGKDITMKDLTQFLESYEGVREVSIQIG